jgi:hypothetical protein
MHKVCTRCGENKPTEAFNKRMQSSDGFNPRCRLCLSRYQKQIYQKHKEKVKESVKAYREKNKEKIKEYKMQNREKHNEYCREWHKANAEKRQAYSREYHKNNPDKKRHNQAKRRAAHIQRTPCWLTDDDKVLIQRKYTLAQKKTETTGEMWVVDHILPLRGEFVSGLHVPSNLRVIKATTNARKYNKFAPV